MQTIINYSQGTEATDMSDYAKKTDIEKNLVGLSVSGANITATLWGGGTITGTVNNVGNANNATKAVQDGAGNVIATTYAKTDDLKDVFDDAFLANDNTLLSLERRSGNIKVIPLHNISTYAKKADLATVATTGSYNDLTDKPEIGGDADELFFGASYTSKIAKISTWPSGLGNVALYFPNVTDIASDAFYKKYNSTPFVQTLHFSVNHRKTIKALTNYPKFGGYYEPTIIFDIDAVTMTINRGNATVVGADGEEITGDTAYIMKSTDTPVFASDGVGLLTATVNEAEDFTYTVSDIPTEGNQVGINITDAGSATVTADYQYSGIYIAKDLTGATTGLYCAENTPLTVLANIVTDTAFLQYSGTVTAMTDITLADCTAVPDYVKIANEYTPVDPTVLETAYGYAASPYYNKEVQEVHSENAKAVGDSVFRGCSQLVTAEFPIATEIQVSAFNACAGLTSLELPAATSIGNYAFSGCAGLTSISLPNVTELNSSAFFEWGTKDGMPDGVARTVHFAAANEETIKALSGYSNSFGCKGTLTMLFDL